MALAKRKDKGCMTHTETYLSETIDIALALDHEKVEQMVRELVALRERKGRLFIIGLGGSAANASHAVYDFRKQCGIEAYAPTDNVAELTARANDESWPFIFGDWMQFANPEDAILVLSVGGGKPTVSAPIVQAVNEASLRHLMILGIVARHGGRSAEYGDCIIIV